MLEEKAFYYYNNKTYGEAISYLDELIRSDSTNGEYYYKRGICYAKLSNEGLAYFNFQKAIEYKYEVADANISIGIIFVQNDKDSIALVYLNKALKAGSTERVKIQELMKICNDQIEFQKTDAGKEFLKYKARTNSSL